MSGTTRILFAGHDFKFLAPLLSWYRRSAEYEVLTDEYSGHVITDAHRSARLLARADVVFCEWCLGNAEWYSQNVRPDQTLIIRFHSQERNLPFLERIDWHRVDRLCFICRHHQEDFVDRYPDVEPRTRLIYNAVDCEAFRVPKESAAAYTLGLLGAAPMQKAPHRAVAVLRELLAVDSRYRLSIKGRQPQEYAWLWRRPEERDYYERFYDSARDLIDGHHLVFEPHGDDVPEWLSTVGFILSTSDHEGSHQAVAEGMASGAVPVIRNWEGAAGLYPARYVFRTTREAADHIRGLTSPSRINEERRQCAAYAAAQFDRDRICASFDRLLADCIAERRPAIIGTR